MKPLCIEIRGAKRDKGEKIEERASDISESERKTNGFMPQILYASDMQLATFFPNEGPESDA